MDQTRSIRIAIGLLAGLGAAFALTRFGAPPKAALETRLTCEAAWRGVAAAAVLYALFVERRPFASLGLRMPSWRDLATAGGAGLLIVAGTVLVYGALFPVLLLSISMSHTPNTMLMPYWYRLAMVTRTAVAGELLFRVYAIERGDEFRPDTGRWIAAAASFAVFAAANWSGWGPVESIATIYGGIVLTLLYLWRRSLVVNAIASAIGLGAGYLVN